MGLGPKYLEVIQDICLDSLQSRSGHLEVLCLNAKGNVLCFYQTIISLRQLVLQHSLILLTDVVESILLGRNIDGTLKFCDIHLLIDEG